MIVELSARDVTRISMGEDVEIGGVTLRLSMSLIESIANGVESLPPANPPAKGAKVFSMHARFNGKCGGCNGFVKAGGPIIRDVRDSNDKRNLCMACGEPVLVAYERETATEV